MGFRDLEVFNKALLAKTAWRLIQNLDDLWCRILKGVYFPKSDFLKARKGSKASWAWTSILEGREVLKEDLCWKIVNGGKVRVFSDDWLTNGPVYSLKPRVLTDEMKNLMVSDLIRDGRWTLENYGNILDEEDIGRIKRVKLPRSNLEDMMMWL
ncbi:uncharacterized protein LOC114746497 [Neltuma alba]|uniref:uncharacterized protein LOC114746497 n=1 Tax=Neltuma alba TaxID=207710 RepID=UPI0010A40FC6|nr:uncharacterized protein LOC114746497 [Prosopis alba]